MLSLLFRDFGKQFAKFHNLLYYNLHLQYLNYSAYIQSVSKNVHPFKFKLTVTYSIVVI
jgi:hypothetical protein